MACPSVTISALTLTTLAMGTGVAADTVVEIGDAFVAVLGNDTGGLVGVVATACQARTALKWIPAWTSCR